MDIPRLHWDHYARLTGGFFHVARVNMSPGRRGDLHRHDFVELFFIEHGRGVHHVNGLRQELARGNLVFIRPDDCHGFEAGGGGMTFVNVAMPMSVTAAIEQRYFARRESDWPWHCGATPMMVRLNLPQLERATNWAERLASGTPNPLLIDAFLLDLLSDSRGSHSALPEWLAQAADRFATVEQFTGGAGRLAALAGRSPEHVNRTLQRLVARTTSEFINDLRVEHAARRLRLSDSSIAEIAFECGIVHVTYFYRIFSQRMDMSPARYRRSQRMGMI